MKITRKPTYSEEKLEGGKVRVSYSVQVDGVEYKREIISRNSDSARKIARDAVTEQVKERNPEQASQIGSNIENYSGSGLASRETPEQARFRETNVSAPAEEHMNFEGATIEGQGPVKPSDMEGYNPEMEDQFSLESPNGMQTPDDFSNASVGGVSNDAAGVSFEEYDGDVFHDSMGRPVDPDGNYLSGSPSAGYRRQVKTNSEASEPAQFGGSQGNIEASENPNSKKEQRKKQSSKALGDAARENRPQRKIHQRSSTQKNHVPWETSFFGTKLDGKGDRELKEPVPRYFNRPDEEIISGPNNSCIILGRDRAPENKNFFSKDVQKRDYEAGFSDYMCAGAIDIVVGRMAPYPVSKIGAFEDFSLAPNFNTTYPAILQGLQLEAGEHPGMMMDAARIYVSQMTTIDENFKIQKNVSTSWEEGAPTINPNAYYNGKLKVVPSSGIMIKADKVRMHSRQDLKIVTGGPWEAVNSMGNQCGNNGIHLIAENGLDKDGRPLPQHPMVLGNNLVKCLFEMNDLIDDCVQCMDHAMAVQMAFNQVLASNFDLLPLPAGTTVPNPFKTIAGMVTTLEQLVKTRFGALFQLLNNFRTKTGYLSDSGDDNHWILSMHITVN